MDTYPNSTNAPLAVHFPSSRHLGYVLCLAASSQHDWRRPTLSDIRSLCALLHCRPRLRISRVQWKRWLHGRAVFAQHRGDTWLLDLSSHSLESRGEPGAERVGKADRGQMGGFRSTAWVRGQRDDT